MNWTDVIIIAAVAAVLCGAAYAIYRSKKSGKKCIGCPDSGSCSGGCSGNCSGCSCGK